MGAAAITGLVVGGISTAASVAQAAQQNANAEAQAKAANKNAQARADAQRKSAEVRSQQLADQAQVERQKVSRQAHRIESRLRVAAGESGMGQGDSFNAMMRQVGFDESTEIGIINQNLKSGLDYVASSIEPVQKTIAPQTDVMFSGLTGGMQGFSTGLNIYGQMNQYMPKKKSDISRLPFADTGGVY